MHAESSNAIDVDRAERFFREAIDAAKNRNKAFIDSMENKALSKEEEMCLLFSSDPSLESVYHSMIRVYSRAGYIDDVVILFGSLEKYLHLLGKLPSTYSYDVLIHGLGRHKRFDEARAYWEDLTNRSTIMPGARLYSTMMRVLVESGDPVSAVLLAGEMSARGIEPSVHTSIVIVHAKALTGDHIGANELFLKTLEKLRQRQSKLAQIHDPRSYLREKEYLDYLQSKLHVTIAKSSLRQGNYTEAKRFCGWSFTHRGWHKRRASSLIGND